MSALARTVAQQTRSRAIRAALSEAADSMRGRSILGRLKVAGEALARSTESFDNRAFRALATHRSDLVRQWACYAINHEQVPISVDDRLKRTLPFASDGNMSVREAAWMAFRPHVQKNFRRSLEPLTLIASDTNDRSRRFAVEVTRPRSVWGSHIQELKQCPEMAIGLLEKVRSDPSRYVQLAVGNWLNDASKTRPDWVIKVCRRWSKDQSDHTYRIVRRALRTLLKDEHSLQKGLLKEIELPVTTALANPAEEVRSATC